MFQLKILFIHKLFHNHLLLLVTYSNKVSIQHQRTYQLLTILQVQLLKQTLILNIQLLMPLVIRAQLVQLVLQLLQQQVTQVNSILLTIVQLVTNQQHQLVHHLIMLQLVTHYQFQMLYHYKLLQPLLKVLIEAKS